MTELAWAAGFFDGEGHVNNENNKGKGKHHLRLQVSQTKGPELLARFCRAVGGAAHVVGPYGPYGKATHAPHWQAVAHGEHVIDVYERLLPYLGSVKREQFRQAIAGSA